MIRALAMASLYHTPTRHASRTALTNTINSSICRHHPCPRPAFTPHPTHSPTPSASSASIPLAQLLAPRRRQRPSPLPAPRPGCTWLQTDPLAGNTVMSTKITYQTDASVTAPPHTRSATFDFPATRSSTTSSRFPTSRGNWLISPSTGGVSRVRGLSGESGGPVGHAHFFILLSQQPGLRLWPLVFAT